MYPNLNAEMARYKVTHADMASLLGKSVSWIGNRLNGKAFFDVKYCVQIREAFFPNCEFNYLFSQEPMQTTA